MRIDPGWRYRRTLDEITSDTNSLDPTKLSRTGEEKEDASRPKNACVFDARSEVSGGGKEKKYE